jgi:hypothetical protein
LPLLRLQVLLLLTFALAPQVFAVTYIVPADRFEIERASAIVVGRVLSSHVEESRFGIETVTSIALEEAIRGTAGPVVRVHEPGGALGGETRIVPGTPEFEDGERVLLLLHQREDGRYTVLDLQLGAFHFTNDIPGPELAVRNASEIEGWDLDGRTHQEQHRVAEPFLAYVRGVVRREAVAEDYFVSTGAAAAPIESLRAASAFTATSYTLSYGSGLGTRWKVFPAAVNWNQGNAETGVLGSGTKEIASAFSTWNAGGTNYVLAGANANTKGFLDAFDGVNNIVFEKNLTSAGVQPFSCASGGALGMGGMTHADFTAGAHVFHGETFGTTLEADVSMNQGLGACTTVSADQFKTVILHELGHTLGFRHSDQNRKLTAACSTDSTLECSNTAVMNHILLSGLNGKLQQWDKTALSSVYGSDPVCTPPSISVQPLGSTITSGNAAQLSVTAGGTAPLSYQWFTGSSGDSSAPINGATTATISVSPQTTTSYWVRVTGACSPAAISSAAIVTVSPGVCPSVVPGTPHATEVSDGFQLSVNVSGGTSFTWRWYEGATPGTGSPVGTGNPLHVQPSSTTTYWCRITNHCGNAANSSAVTITVTATPKSTRRRAARH